MKNKTILQTEYQSVMFKTYTTIKSIMLITVLLLGSFSAVQAQDLKYTKPSWWFGAAAATNLNFYRGSTQQLNSDFRSPTAFHNGFGMEPFFAIDIEYHRPKSLLGFMFQAGYDVRDAKFNEIITPCDCPANLTSELSYITLEPSLRFTPFRSNFYLYGGPRFAFVQQKSFEYQLGINPNFPLQAVSPEIKGDFSEVKNTLISMQIGMGYDLAINAETSKTQWVVSPFVAFHPYFGQKPRATETLNVSTVRAGFIIKFGQGHPLAMPVDGTVQLSVVAPKNVPFVHKVRETFPIRNYVFFDEGSSKIPSRYIVLNKGQIANFKEDQIALNTPANMSGRSERQMVVYYNVLNILGDRMVKYPSTAVTLIGSSSEGADDGVVMAQSIKTYLVTVFGIASARIAIEGQVKPVFASEQPGGTRELELLREGDRRVSIESKSPELLMEFQSGPTTPLKPIEIVTMDDNPENNAVVFDMEGSEEIFTSWNVLLKDERGKTKTYGPYTESKVSIPVTTVLGGQPEGDYKVVLNGNTKSGNVITKEATVHVVPYKAPVIQESIRFSVLYEFNESKSTSIYEKYLTEIVTAKITNGATVMITGHTDIIGEMDYNKNLSMARANDVKVILEKSLAKAGKTNVKLEIYGNGEDEQLAPFRNKYPEERFYNRTVVIDIISK